MRAITTLLTLISGVVFLPPALADSLNSSQLKANKAAQVMRMPMYQPPMRGAPNIRVGGGTRGTAGIKPTVSVLAPEHVGLTTSEQPVLSWYLSAPDNMRLEILVVDEEAIDPLLELSMKADSLHKGLQTLNLAEHGVKLQPGKKYQWSVVLVSADGHRSNDIISSGMIERRPLTSSLKARLANANSQDDVFIYAEEGYWYDAISELTGLIKKNPDNETFKQQRQQLLNQVGLLNLN